MFGRHVVFVLKNPSVAGGKRPDNTKRKVEAFAYTWDCGSYTIVNPHALIATYASDLLKAEDPVGPENDQYIMAALVTTTPSLLVVGWGVEDKWMRGRIETVKGMLRACRVPPMAFKINKDGSPAHPLYQKRIRPLVPFPLAERAA